jgi:hypothetical protein
MRVMHISPLLLALSLGLSGCNSVTIPTITACTPAGRLSAGLDCSTTSGVTSSMTLDESLTFLEPTETRGGAICMSAEDYSKIKTVIESACRKLNGCQKEKVKQVIARIDTLQSTAKAKRRK